MPCLDAYVLRECDHRPFCSDAEDSDGRVRFVSSAQPRPDNISKNLFLSPPRYL